MAKRRPNLQNDLMQFERMEAIKTSMKCGGYEEVTSVETTDPIYAQVEVWKNKTARGNCDHIDITGVERYSKDNRRIIVRFRCCRIRR